MNIQNFSPDTPHLAVVISESKPKMRKTGSEKEESVGREGLTEKAGRPT